MLHTPSGGASLVSAVCALLNVSPTPGRAVPLPSESDSKRCPREKKNAKWRPLLIQRLTWGRMGSRSTCWQNTLARSQSALCLPSHGYMQKAFHAQLATLLFSDITQAPWLAATITARFEYLFMVQSHHAGPHDGACIDAYARTYDEISSFSGGGCVLGPRAGRIYTIPALWQTS